MILLMALIALSVIAFCIETVPEHRHLGTWYGVYVALPEPGGR